MASFENKETLNFLGINFETGEDIEIETLESKIDGIFTFSFKDGFLEEDSKLKDQNLANTYKKVTEKSDEESNNQKIEEYYAGCNMRSDDDYFGSAEYQDELAIIDAKWGKVYDEVKGDYSKENIKKLELAENEREFEIELLDEKYFGISGISGIVTPKKLVVHA